MTAVDADVQIDLLCFVLSDAAETFARTGGLLSGVRSMTTWSSEAASMFYTRAEAGSEAAMRAQVAAHELIARLQGMRELRLAVSGLVNISPGGMTAVSTEELRLVGSRVALAMMQFEDAGLAILTHASGSPAILPVLDQVVALTTQVVQAAADGRMLADALRRTADAYELVELYAMQLMHERGRGPDGVDPLDTHRQIDELAERNPQAQSDAWRLFTQWKGEHGDEFLTGHLPPTALGMFGLMVPNMLLRLGAGGLMGALGGRIEPGQRLRGQVADPQLRPQPAPAAPTRAPQSLRESVGRIPRGPEASMRVERYEFADGHREFALYLSGTRPEQHGTVLSWASAGELYAGNTTEAYRAAELALADAGAALGDTVHVHGHSQGGMIAHYLAASGDFDVPTLVTTGSPSEAMLGDETTVVTFRHDDDLVPLLTDGGWAAPTGSDDSVLVENTVRPGFDLGEARMEPHSFERYLDTVSEFEASGNPRVPGAGEYLKHLAEAERVELFQYAPVESGVSGGGGVRGGGV